MITTICDMCGVKGERVRWCETCGVDFCGDCALGAHPVMHEIASAEQERVRRELG